MKASEIIQRALDTRYCRDVKEIQSLDKHRGVFMCHAIQWTLADLTGKHYGDVQEEADAVTDLFMPRLYVQGTSCLTNYLYRTDKKYRAIAKRYSHYTPSTFARRVKFWEDLIAELQAKGL